MSLLEVQDGRNLATSCRGTFEQLDVGTEFSVTEYYEKVCVPEGVIPIVIDVPRLRHVGPIRGAAPVYLPTGTRLPDCPHPLHYGPIYDVLPRDFRTKKIGILPASIFMPTVYNFSFAP